MPGPPVRPELLPFAERFRKASRLLGDHADAARTGQVSVHQFRRYLSARNMPPVEVLSRVSVAAGVRVEWLLTGEGPMMKDQLEPRAAPVARTLGAIERDPATQAAFARAYPDIEARHTAGQTAHAARMKAGRDALERAQVRTLLEAFGHPDRVETALGDLHTVVTEVEVPSDPIANRAQVVAETLMAALDVLGLIAEPGSSPAVTSEGHPTRP